METTHQMGVVQMLLAMLLVMPASGQNVEIHAASPGSKSLAALDSCVNDPMQSNCTSYNYPVAAAAEDLSKLCNAMPFMAACSVSKLCNASGAGPDAPTGPGAAKISRNNPNVCQPFNQVSTVCKLDIGMSRMSGCNNINTMCVSGSKVPICSAQTGLADLPHTEVLNSQVRSICEEMSMDGCEKCMPSWQAGRQWADCDLLEVYSSLCYQMPDMSQCSDWHNMCKADSSFSLCYGTDGSGDSSSGGGLGPGPVMKMYFFEDLPFYLLFKSWTPRNSAELCGAWFAVFALGLLYEFLQMVYGRFESGFWARVNGRTYGPNGRVSAHPAQGLDLENGRPIAEGYEDLGYPLNDDDSASSEAQKPTSCCSSHKQKADPAVPAAAAGLMGPTAAVSCRLSPASTKAVTMNRRPSGCSGPGQFFKSYFDRELLLMDVIRGLARFVLAGLAYLLMLAAMSFHVGIFFAVISGVGVGSMLFGRWRFATGTAEGYSHCGCGSS